MAERDPMDAGGENADLLAAELVLGLLSQADMAEARSRADRDPAFARAVAAWETRLTPLIDGVAPVDPSARVWRAVRSRLPVDRAQVGRGFDNVAMWRATSAGLAALLAATLAVAILAPGVLSGRAPASEATRSADGRIVAPPPVLASARLDSEGGRVLFVITLDAASNRILVTPIDAEPGPARAYQLWLLPPPDATGGAPVSLGLLPRNGATATPLTATLAPGAALAISVEPAGGSPTGQPTGPVVAQGRLAAV